jgi:hypothetical protein
MVMQGIDLGGESPFTSQAGRSRACSSGFHKKARQASRTKAGQRASIKRERCRKGAGVDVVLDNVIVGSVIVAVAGNIKNAIFSS